MCNTDVKSGTEMYAKLYPESSSDGVGFDSFGIVLLSAVVRFRQTSVS